MTNIYPKKPKYTKIVGWIFLFASFTFYISSFFIVYGSDYGENVIYIKRVKRFISDNGLYFYKLFRLFSGILLILGIIFQAIHFYLFYIIYVNKINSNARDK